VDVHQPELVSLGEDVGGVGMVLVVLGRLRADLLLRELVRERAQRALLVGELELEACGGGALGDHRLLRSID
jgi:hypothetical protein